MADGRNEIENDGEEHTSSADWLIPLEPWSRPASSDAPDGQPEELGSCITANTTDRAVRSHRKEARKSIEGIWVLLEPDVNCGGSAQVECPLVDISISGFSVIYDRPISVGMKGYVSYRSTCDKPIRVAFAVRRCTRLSESRYLIGASLGKRLNIEDRRPAKTRPGRQVVLGVRARRILAETPTETPALPTHEFRLPVPHVIAPPAGETEEIPLADD